MSWEESSIDSEASYCKSEKESVSSTDFEEDLLADKLHGVGRIRMNPEFNILYLNRVVL